MRLLLLLPLVPLASCSGQNCTDIGCNSQVTVRFAADLADGSYTVELAEPMVPPSTCLVVITGGAAEPASDCDLWAEMRDGQLEATLYATPTDLAVALIPLGSDALVDEVITPTYTSLSPNGEACGPTCEQATEVIEFR